MILMREFDWNRLGDIKIGRQNLGTEMPVSVYRLMEYTLMDTLTDEYGKEQSEHLFRSAGFRAGFAFAENLLDTSLDFNAFIKLLQKVFKDNKIGIFRMEKTDLSKMEFTMTVEEDLDCSGLPVSGDTVCVYDEGFIAGILNAYTKKEFTVKEIDCWASGGRICRFTASIIN